MIIVRAVQTCWACPAQWDAETLAGNRLYLRYRYGHGTVNLDDPSGPLVADFDTGRPYDGGIDLDEFCDRAGLVLAAPHADQDPVGRPR
ncbi:hypothetical protein [Streptomonospora litoralis]|uniref:Uncharacterized protein n=1 Tax=Streptomonospora litoralis TaxID=2498135 RepID=A0A4P6Q068_9ACTN|nr:hypothetical protein [Streptomonospora litoralis]QBI53450.1 hypothetical protein EKD16_08280 [Streptomonospora litoralis]